MPHGWQGQWHHAVTCDARTGTGTRCRAQLSARRDEERAQTMFQRVFSTLVLATFLVSAVVTGCAPVTVQQTTLTNTYTDVRADILTTGELSHMTQQVLRMQGIRPAAQEQAHIASAGGTEHPRAR